MTTIRVVDHANRADITVINDIEITGLDLSFLTGSEKQIAWATKIIGESMVGLVKDLAIKDALLVSKSKAAEIVALSEKIVARAMQAAIRKPSAGWWIDNRHLYPRMLFEAASK